MYGIVPMSGVVSWTSSARSSAKTGSQLSRLWTFCWIASPVTQVGWMLLASACSTSISMGNFPLSLQILYLRNVSPLEVLAFLSRCIVVQLILLCAGLNFINQDFFLEQQPFGTPPLMNAFHQITISQHSREGQQVPVAEVTCNPLGFSFGLVRGDLYKKIK